MVEGGVFFSIKHVVKEVRIYVFGVVTIHYYLDLHARRILVLLSLTALKRSMNDAGQL